MSPLATWTMLVYGFRGMPLRRPKGLIFQLIVFLPFCLVIQEGFVLNAKAQDTYCHYYPSSYSS